MVCMLIVSIIHFSSQSYDRWVCQVVLSIGSTVICLGEVRLCALVLLYLSRASSHTESPRGPSWDLYYLIYIYIYINDLPLMTNICSLESYVDDSKLYISFPMKDIDIIAEQLTEDLRRIAAWCCANSLLINPDKTKLLLLGTRQMLRSVPEDFHVTLLGKQLCPVSSAKDLGVTIDASLTYDEHVSNVVSSCTASLCQINRIKHILDRQTLITMFDALVFSKLYYCSSVWANTSKKNLAKKTPTCSKFCSPNYNWHKKARTYFASIKGVELATGPSHCSVQGYRYGV